MFKKPNEIEAQLEQCNRKLQACNARIQDLMTKGPDGNLIVDMNRKILFANPAAATIFGCKTNELLDKQFDFLFEPDKTTELKLRSRDGKAIVVEAWAIETGRNANKAFFIALHDISERKKNEQELQKLYRAVLQSPSLVIITDASGNFEFVNPKFTEVTGYTLAEIAGKNPRILRSGKTPPEVYKELWETILAGREWHGEMVNRKKNGELYWEYAAISPIKDIDGEITSFIAVTEEITARKEAEEALRESENKFSKAFQATPSGLVISSLANGVYKEANEAFERSMGYRRDELIGHSSLELNIWQNQEDRTYVIRMLAEGKKVRDLEIGFRSKSGSILICSYSAEIIEIGAEQCLLSLLNDITARKKAEEALRKSEKKFLTIFHAVPAILGITTLAEGRFVDVNERCVRGLGYQRNEVIGRTTLELGIWESQADRDRAMRVLRERGTVCDIEIYLKGKTGEAFIGLLSAEFIEIDGEQHILSMINDITERKRAEEALRWRTSELEAVFRAFPDSYFWVDAEERIIDYKAGAIADLYAPPEVFLGKRMQEVLPPDVGVQMHAAVQQVLTTGVPAALEYWLPISEVKQVFEARLLLLPGDQVFCVVRNITPRKQAEDEIERLNTDLATRAAELEAANAELEAFNYTVAHDLRQPLNVISSYCQIIKELCSNNLDEQCKGYLQETYDATLGMNRLIEALLNFSRMGHVEPRLDMVDLCALAHEVAAELKLTEPERQVDFRIDAGIAANADANLMRVVLDNLLGNAWKYTGIRKEAVIEFGATEIDGKPVYFVRDNGAGFDMADADKLFVPFQRLPGAEAFRGFGIGLATVERIVRRHGGRAWAEGAPGKGATVYFTLT